MLDWRLDHTGTHSAGTGPLRWQPAIPPALAALPKWECLQRRHDRVADLADAIRRTATAWTHTDAPAWARPLLGVNRGLLAEIAVFRAATGVPEEDTRIAGPEQYPVRTRAVQALLEQQAAAAIGRRDADTSRWNTILDDINPHIRRDSYYPQLAAHLATVARTGVDIRQLLTDAAQRGPLPDELPAAALWWRLAGTLAPATIDTPSSGLRPAWMPDLHRVFGSTLAEAITADPAWPGLVAAVAAADRRRWTPLDLLTVAAEHLRDADPDEQLRPDEYARLLTYSIDLFTTEHPFSHDIPVPAEPPPSPEEDEELRHRYPDPQHPDTEADTLLDALGFTTDTPPAPARELIEPDPLGTHYDDLGGLDFDDLPTQRPATPPLQPALDDVHALRAQEQQARDRLAQLQVGIDESNGPAVRAAMPRIGRLRRRAAADRPYRSRIEDIFAQWADAEQHYDDMQTQIRWAQTQAERLRAEGADELDIVSAEAEARFLREHLPPTPAERFYDTLTAAVAARAEAAGGAEHIVTDEDVDTVIAQATQADSQALHTARTRLQRVSERLARAEAAAAAAFAAAETHSADHVLDRMDALRTELAVLEAAGDLQLHRQLTLPPTATDHLPDPTAGAVTSLAASPFTVTPVHAGDTAVALEAMQVLHAAAAARERKVLWCTNTGEDAENARAADVADTITDLATAHRRLTEGDWTLPTGTLVVVDHASAADPSVIADLAGHAQRSEASLILLDPGETRWPPAPSAALLKLLHEDLPWAVTLSVNDSTPRRRSPQPDLDPVLDQAERLDDQLHTDELREALARRAQLRDQHQSSYRVHTELWRATHRDADRHRDSGREL